MLTDAHRATITAAGITVEVAETAGVRSATTIAEIPEHARWCRSAPGIVFPWRSPGGAVVEQYRPDTPVSTNGDDTLRKYLWPSDTAPMLNVHPAMGNRVMDSTAPIVVVEGTKQTLAAVTAAVALDVAIVGVAGCYGWMSDGQPVDDLGRIPWTDRDVVVIYDADIRTNRDVHDAAGRLADDLELRGAKEVRFAHLPGSGSDGLDDVLVSRAVDGSTTAPFRRLLTRAGKLGKRPAASTNKYFGPDGLMVARLVDAVRARLHLAVDPGDRLLVYESGVYIDGRHHVTAAIGDLLGDTYRPIHARAIVELMTARLVADGLVILDSTTTVLVNVRNGLLDPFTGILSPHTAEHLSLVQFPIDWRPDAVCPMFDAWLHEVTDGRGDDLLEAAAQILDMRGDRQRKAVFLHGPTRSAKSTFVRLLEALVGYRARSAVTLHELAGNRFATADLFGKVLNAAAELSAAHVDDLATFKQVTGDDPVRAERKYGQPFTFRSRALFVFAANEIPTVSEVSGAYLARIRPYKFPTSFEGREDPGLEQAMLGELPGILVRLVGALRRFEARGGYIDDERSRSALDDFARHSDRVRLFLYETCTPIDDGFVSRTDLFTAFEEWAKESRRHSLGRHRFYEHVDIAGYRAAKRAGVRGFVGLEQRHEHEWGPPDEPAPKPTDSDQNVSQSDDKGQLGQVSPTPASCAREKEEEEKGRVREGWGKAAPSAPNEFEVQTW